MGEVMGMEVLVFAVSVVFITCLIKVLNEIWWRPRQIENQLNRQGIHGQSYRLFPAKMVFSKQTKTKSGDAFRRPNPFLSELAMVHKRVFVVWVGTMPRLIILDPALIRELLINKNGDFRLTERNRFSSLFITGLVVYDGDKWMKHRKIINPAFHMEKLKRMFPELLPCSEQLIGKWKKLAGRSGSCELDVTLEFHNVTGDVISKAAFGSNFQVGRTICALQKEQSRLFAQAYYNLIFPCLSYLPTKVNRRMRQIYKQVEDLLIEIIEQRKKNLKSKTKQNEDLLGLLLKSNQNEVEENKNSDAGMSTDDVIGECRLFYFAGQETTANLLTWTMICLATNKNWQEKAREEVLQIIGQNSPTFVDLTRLKVIHMILLEVLRLYPPSSILRRTYKETKLGEMTIPAGVQVFIPVHLVHSDEENWGEDATEFNPLRFSDGISQAAKNPNSYIPFGGGPRICVGQNFAFLEAKLLLSRILQSFEFEISGRYVHSPTVSVTLHPKYGAQIILKSL